MNCVFTLDRNKLFLGNIRSPTSQMRAVLSVIDAPVKHKDCFHKWIPAEDSDDFRLIRFFDEAADYIHDHLRKGNVLVHCYAGISRSASIVIAYLIKYHGFSTERALKTIQQSRMQAQPNNGFIRQLRDFEQRTKPVKSYLNDQISPRLLSPKT